MSILDKLSSNIGDRTEAANKRVAARALRKPALLEEIAAGLASEEARLAGDCAEVMTEVAEKKPELVAPHAKALIAQIDHPDTRVRWEAMHSLSRIAALVPRRVTPILPLLSVKIDLDQSVIVRDYAIVALGEFGGTSRGAARRAWPYVRRALKAWGGRHAAKALEAAAKIIAVEPTLRNEAQRETSRFTKHKGAKVRTLARRLLE